MLLRFGSGGGAGFGSLGVEVGGAVLGECVLDGARCVVVGLGGGRDLAGASGR